MYPQYPPYSPDQRVHYEYSTSPQDAYFQRQRFNHVHDVVARIVALLGGSLIALLSLRFVFALLAANQANGIASFVNGFTQPFVTPFYGLFTYDHASIGSVSFQGYTLVALFAYGLITTVLTRLATITRY